VTSAFFSGNELYTANVGDSRTVLISVDEDDSKKVKVRSLTTDHKPDFQSEKNRIHTRGGRVAQAQDFRGRFSGPQRVWVKNVNSPGLAMSRSIGDCIAHSVGCSCEPDVTLTLLTPQDKIVLLASDGIWEFLSNQQVANIVYQYFSKDAPEAAANALVSVAL
jgi:serine/threonine protein phosphatase PrpC